MVKVRLARAGAKMNPFYHVVVLDSRSPREGRRLERIGSYDPKRPVTEARIDQGRLDYWLGVGAQPSETVAGLIRRMKAAATAAKS